MGQHSVMQQVVVVLVFTTLALMVGRSFLGMMSGSCTTTTTRFRKLRLNRRWPMRLLLLLKPVAEKTLSGAACIHEP
ncbi:Proteasome subunit beta type [Zea mays]|uniref:Proteasome subunit beta type n=1 Tax=Zea mays TaxID=4577 RepID=A0A1D6NV80_MAIZE|nr:Proteasome subunit beta type [Zea mays]